MCLHWLFFKRDIPLKRFDGFFPCACNICGRNFENMEKFIQHSGFHSIEDINNGLYTQLVTVGATNVLWNLEQLLIWRNIHALLL